MRFHLMSLLYATFISIGLFVILALVHEEKTGWCALSIGDSTATMPCTELDQKVYEVKL